MKNNILNIFVTVILLSQAIPQAEAKIVFKNEFLIEDDGINKFIMDSHDNVSSDLTLQFGNTLGETIHFDTVNNWFEISDGLSVFGSTLVEHIDAGQSFRVNDAANDPSPFLIDQDGNIGIKNGAPSAPLDIQATGQTIELGDGTANNISITFDDGADRNFTWNNAGLRFDLSEALNINGGLTVNGNTDFNLNQAIEFRFENLGAAPICNAGSKGRTFFNTADNGTYVCDGVTFNMLGSGTGHPHYHNGVSVQNIKTATRTGVNTSGEETTIYLTDDGTAAGTKLFTSVYHVSASAAVVQTLAEAPSMNGYSYNAGTGALTIKFLESAGVLIGGQGLEAEEAGTAFTVFVVGI